MIQNRNDYKEYFKEDLRATGLKKSLRVILFDRRYKFYKYLRLAEYYTNCKNGFFAKLIRLKYKVLCDRYMWTIPINVFGKGLQLVHYGPIIVSGNSKIGDYARVHVGVNIGWAPSHGVDGTPVIGNYCYIGPGAKLFGPIVLGDNICIGANSVVNKSFEGNCTIAGVPAKKISDNTSKAYINIS